MSVEGKDFRSFYVTILNDLPVCLCSFFFFFLDFIYLVVREADTQAEGEAGSKQGAQQGT